MEMEDHHNHNQNQHYGMPDLRQLMRSTPPHFPSMGAQADVFQPHPNLTHYDIMMLGRHHSLQEFGSDSPTTTVPTTTPPTATASTPPLTALDAADTHTTPPCLAGDPSTARWPRQETLTLLDIRSRLHSKFKDANQKGPLWDEVSRIMSEEHGYQRSGKKCREKFENLYKYYKKTKEGKAGRQDGKHYRFFRQLEALYGGNNTTTNPTSPLPPETNYGSTSTTMGFHHTHTTTPSQPNQDTIMFHNHIINGKHCESLSLTNSTEFDTSSSDDDNSGENESTEKGMMGRRKRSGWKGKIKEFMDSQMRKLIEKQEAWLDRLVKTLEQKEKERALREEEWRRQEAERLEREHKFWAKERAWIEARDAALMDALHKLTGADIIKQPPPPPPHHHHDEEDDGSEKQNESSERWDKCEITKLVELRDEVESGFEQSGCSEEVMWEEVANKMTCFGYQRTASMCKHKWESVTSKQLGMNNKKRKEKSRSSNFNYLHNNILNDQTSLYTQTQPTAHPYCDINQQRRLQLQTNDASSPSPSDSNVGNAVHADVSCFPFFNISAEGENLWDNYGLKLNKANQNH
ncbi:trihelix transcription factor PTL [Senna tora]|uniref:Trihelix transcription factor PTL n=1 Tax=Senna tora TaxID=362788 RepID=A0A834WF88_9FABA|nr:trihelix transcription factor PTL [Senna tora]